MFSPQVPLDDLATSLVSEHPAPDSKQHNVRKPKTWKFWKRQPKQSPNVPVMAPNGGIDELRNAQIRTLQSIRAAGDRMISALSVLCVVYRGTVFDTELVQLRADGEALCADTSRAMIADRLSRTLIAVLYARSMELMGRYENVVSDVETYRHALEVRGILQTNLKAAPPLTRGVTT